MMLNAILVGGLEHFLFSHILGIIIPIDFHIFQRGSNHQPARTMFWGGGKHAMLGDPPKMMSGLRRDAHSTAMWGELGVSAGFWHTTRWEVNSWA